MQAAGGREGDPPAGTLDASFAPAAHQGDEHISDHPVAIPSVPSQSLPGAATQDIDDLLASAARQADPGPCGVDDTVSGDTVFDNDPRLWSSAQADCLLRILRRFPDV